MVPVKVRCSVLTLENTLSWAAEIAETFLFFCWLDKQKVFRLHLLETMQ